MTPGPTHSLFQMIALQQYKTSFRRYITVQLIKLQLIRPGAGWMKRRRNVQSLVLSHGALSR